MSCLVIFGSQWIGNKSWWDGIILIGGTITWLNYWNLTSSVFLSRYKIIHYWILWISPSCSTKYTVSICHYKSQIILNKNQVPPKEIRSCMTTSLPSKPTGHNTAPSSGRLIPFCAHLQPPTQFLSQPGPTVLNTHLCFPPPQINLPLACIAHVLSRVSSHSVSTKPWPGSVHFTPNLTTSRFRLI